MTYFIQAADRTTAKKACPTATRIIKVDGGYMCFETETDYQTWKQQT
jgi:hypothetical protein